MPCVLHLKKMGGDWMIQGEGILIPILGFAMDPQQLISLNN